MTLFIAFMAVANMLGGRWENIWPASRINGRILWRCIIPGIAAGLYAESFYVWMAVTAGSALWFPWGWSFEEIHGERDMTKYPAWVRWIGYQIMPYNEANIKRDKLRGALIKGIRGSFDILTFALLTAVNPYAMLFWLGTFLQGIIYWLCGKLFKTNQVLIAEIIYGAWRGLLIGLAL